MFQGSASTMRCLVVWLAATASAGATWWLAAGAAAALVRPTTWQRSFEDLLVAVCALALLVCAGRLWLVTTATTAGLLRGRPPRKAGGLTRRLVFAACGMAVVAGVAAPATAASGGDLERLAGLPLPDRATAGAVAPAEPAEQHPAGRPAHSDPAPGGDEVVVRSGDSLWSISAALLPRDAGASRVDDAWRAIYAANRAEIGTDPGLVRPGQRLHLPVDTFPHARTGEDVR